MNWEDRFMKYVEKHPGGCWEWTGCTFRNGRGAFYFNGKARIAYRFFYTMKKGRVPKNMDIHHKCENILCVRIGHMKLEDHKEHVSKLHADNHKKGGIKKANLRAKKAA